MGRYTTARSFDDRSTEVQAAPTEAEKAKAGSKDILEVSNVMGSTAGAGSGEFHNYRNTRRKELLRAAKIKAGWAGRGGTPCCLSLNHVLSR